MARRARRESERIPSRLVVAIDGQGRSCGGESACPVAAAYAAHRNPRERDAGAASIGVTNEWGENGLGLLPFATSEPLTTEDQHQRRRVSEPLAPEGIAQGAHARLVVDAALGAAAQAEEPLGMGAARLE